jgi:large subunit ribosomal protein L25
VAADRKIHMKVPLHFSNQELSPAVKQSAAIVSHILTEIDVSCLPANLPRFIAVDLSGLSAGHPLHLSDITLPEGVTAVLHGNDNPVLVVATVKGGADVEEAPAAAAAAPAAKPAAKAPAKK